MLILYVNNNYLKIAKKEVEIKNKLIPDFKREYIYGR